MLKCVPLALLLSAAGAGALESAGKPPNFVIMFVDDWGWGDLGVNCLAAKQVPGANSVDKETACSTAAGSTLTPNLDALARGGMRFTDFHATGVCTPSRAQLQTGRQGARTGVTFNFQPGSLGGLPLQERTVASFLKPLGYATAAAGKVGERAGCASPPPLPPLWLTHTHPRPFLLPAAAAPAAR